MRNLLIVAVCGLLLGATPPSQPNPAMQNPDVILYEKHDNIIVSTFPCGGKLFLTCNKGGIIEVVNPKGQPPKTWEDTLTTVNTDGRSQTCIFVVKYMGHTYLINTHGGIAQVN
jgi:hypothetical protein